VRRFLVLLLFVSCCLGSGNSAQSQSSAQSQPPAAAVARKVVRKTIPTYPEIAKRARLTGTVKVIAVVSPDGTVKKVEPVGGSPILIQAAEQAVSSWKFAPAGGDSREVVEMRFNP